MEIAPRIVADEKIRQGKPIIAGTRVSIDLVIERLASGMTTEEVMQEYDLAKEDVLAALAYAAHSLADEQVKAV